MYQDVYCIFISWQEAADGSECPLTWNCLHTLTESCINLKYHQLKDNYQFLQYIIEERGYI